jgi:hypothetical protein
LVYAYSTLLEELDNLKTRRMVLIQDMNESNEEEIKEILESIDEYIDQTEDAIKLLEKEVFVD